jgi:hypothetical protein
MEEEPMSDPGFTRPDPCSIPTAAGPEELAGAFRDVFSADRILVTFGRMPF